MYVIGCYVKETEVEQIDEITMERRTILYFCKGSVRFVIGSHGTTSDLRGRDRKE